MLHPQLLRQVKKHFGNIELQGEDMNAFLQSINDTYNNYDRDRKLNEHAFEINEQEYDSIHKQLISLNQNLEVEVTKRIKEIREIASLPLENPTPVFRVSSSGKILFQNSPASQLKNFFLDGKICAADEFFALKCASISKDGKFEIVVNNKDYLFNYKITEGGDINFYGVDVTEKNVLQQKAYDNFYRLNNFLESTDEAYYIIYTRNKEKNFFTSKWGLFYGFNPGKSKDVLEDRRKKIPKDALSAYDDAFEILHSKGKSEFRYPIKNNSTGETFWLDESISKHYDPISGDTIISGRITNVTKEHLYAMQMKESEERFKLMMEAIPVMVWVSDKNNKVTYSNKAVKDFFGISIEDMDDYNEYANHIHPDDLNIAVGAWNKRISKRKTSEVEYRLKDIKGFYHNIYEKAVPRFLETGEFAGYIGAYFDLTKDKQYQQQIFEEKEKLDRISSHSPDIIFVTDELGTIEYVSPSAHHILGYELTHLEGKKIENFIPKEDYNKLKILLSSKKQKFKPSTIEYRMLKANGEFLWVESASSVMKANNKNDAKLLMHNRDITALKKAESVLKESEQKYRGLFENMQLGILEVDLNENVLWMNNAFEGMTGYKLRNIKGKNAVDLFMHTVEEKNQMLFINEERKEKKNSTYETTVKRKDGKLLDLVISGAPIIDLSGNNRGSIGIHWDVSDIRAMEQMIAEEALTRQHEIMEATLNAEERQKELLGGELHDSVGQILTYTSLYLQVASTGSAADFNPQVFQKAQQKILEALNEVRRISRSLVPPALTDLGLKEALVEFLNQYSELKEPEFTLTANERVFVDITYEAQIMIYRVVQELSNNTLKYARSSKANVLFARSKTSLTLHYSDNGIGFDENNIKKGVGLKSINSRVSYYNGSFKISSSKKEGSNFIINLPLINIKKK